MLGPQQLPKNATDHGSSRELAKAQPTFPYNRLLLRGALDGFLKVVVL